MKKKSLIILIILLFIILIALIFAFMYFFTDAFKSNQKLFTKYISQNNDIFALIEDKDIQVYRERKQNTSYTSDGSIKTNVTFTSSGSEELANALNNCNITFTGNTDKSNNYFYRNVKANYSDTQSLQFEIVQNKDIYGLKINDVLSRFVGIQNNDLKTFMQRMEVDENLLRFIPDKIELSKILTQDLTKLFNKEDMTTLKKKYLDIILNSLTEDMYSKENTNEETVYILNISGTTAKKIVTDILINVKDDEEILGKIRNYLSSSANIAQEDLSNYISELKNSIQEMINQLNSTQSEQYWQDLEYKIKVYNKNRKLSKTEIISQNTTDEKYKVSLIKLDKGMRFEFLQNGQTAPFSIIIEKDKTVEDLKYKLVVNNGNEQLLELNTNFNGITTQQVKETSELNCDIDDLDSILGNVKLNQDIENLDIVEETTNSAENKFLCVYNNTNTFAVDFTKIDIANDVLLLNTAPKLEHIQTLFTQIGTRFSEINSTKMKAAGIDENNNPFIYYIPSIIPAISPYYISEYDYALPLLGIVSGGSMAILYGDNSVLDNVNNTMDMSNLTSAKEMCLIIANETITNYYAEVYGGNNTNKNITADELDSKIIEAIKDDTNWNNIEVTRTIEGKTIILKSVVDNSTAKGILNNGNITWEN